jgi:hypothetical protein
VATGLWFAVGYWRLLAWLFTPFFMPAQVALALTDHALQVVAVLLLGIGIFALSRRRVWHFIFLLLGPSLLLVPTALIHVYPFDPRVGGRLDLFVFLAVAVLMGGGLAYAVRSGAASMSRSRWPAAAGFLVVLVFAGRGLYPLLTNRSIGNVPREELRDLVAGNLVKKLQPGDSVYVYYGAVAGFEYYAPQLRPEVAPDSRELEFFDRDGVHVAYGSAHWGAPFDLSSEVETTLRSSDSGRVWIVLSHMEAGDEETLTTRDSGAGLIQDSWEEPGAALYLLNNGAATRA